MSIQNTIGLQINLSNPTKVPSWIDFSARARNFEEDGISLTSDFPCGNGQYFKRIAPFYYSFHARVAKQRFSYRFYLKIESQESPKNIKLRVVDFKMFDRPMKKRELAAMFSCNNKIWQPILPEDISILPDYWEADEDYNEAGEPYSVEYNLKPAKFPVWVGSPMPYTVEALARLIKDVKEHSSGEVITIGKTPYGLDIPMVTIKDVRDKDNDKKKVFVIGGQHPSEVAGILVIEGMIRELLVSPELCRSTFYFIPIVDMDGFYFGRTRANCSDEVGCNLNDDGAVLSQMETKDIFRMIQSVRPDIFIDCHNGRGWDEYRLQCFQPTAENISFIAKLKTVLESDGKKVEVMEVGRKGISSVEVVRKKFAPIGFVFENILTVEPSRKNYLSGGKDLLHAIVRTLKNQ